MHGAPLEWGEPAPNLLLIGSPHWSPGIERHVVQAAIQLVLWARQQRLHVIVTDADDVALCIAMACEQADMDVSIYGLGKYPANLVDLYASRAARRGYIRVRLFDRCAEGERQFAMERYVATEVADIVVGLWDCREDHTPALIACALEAGKQAHLKRWSAPQGIWIEAQGSVAGYSK